MSIAAATRQRVLQTARYRCGYCQTQEVVSGVPLTLEHLIPKAHGGSDEEENLWLSCRLCNEAKGTLMEVTDPHSGESVPLYHPRTQEWRVHFTWSEDSTHLIGLTAVGRATMFKPSPSIANSACVRVLSRSKLVTIPLLTNPCPRPLFSICVEYILPS